MQCDYCIAGTIVRETMKEATAQRAVELFVDLATGARMVEFTYTGGEPLTAFPVLLAITDFTRQRVKDAGIEASFVLKTNGTILNSEVLAFLRAQNIKVVVSIDGGDGSHDTHRRMASGQTTHATVRENFRTLLDNGVPCVASVTVHPSTASTVLEGVRFLHELGVKRIDIGPAYGTVRWSDEQVQELCTSLLETAKFVHACRKIGEQLEVGPFYKETEHVGGVLSECWGCHAASSHLAFLPDGRISGCSALAMLADAFPELILGDVFDGLDQSAVNRMLSLAQSTDENRSKCQQCDTRNNCTGGCLAINYATMRNPLAPPSLYCSTIATIPPAWQKAWGSD
jgi:uncharacterized protein